MKKFSLLLLVSIISVLAYAQSSSDPVYGFGTVPTKNGKVVFEREVECGTVPAETAYKAVVSWAKGRYVVPVVVSGKISENAPSDITVRATEIITFKKTDFITDESKISYNLHIDVSDGKCTLTFSDINYRYEEERDGGGMQFTAEEWITDKEAFNRSGSKLLKSTGKFRVRTIDLVNAIRNEVNDAISEMDKADN